jgi:hypothetical protein
MVTPSDYLLVYSPTSQIFLGGAYLHPVELKYMKLQLGDVLLEWADSLYRMDTPASIKRARELYKAVLLVHKHPLNLGPSWTLKATYMEPGHGNPLEKAQIARARLGFTQIEAGLNWFGFSDEQIPMLRYEILKAAADTLATSAKNSQNDLISSIGQLENLTI